MSSKDYAKVQIEDDISHYKWLKFELGYDNYPASQMINTIENHLANPATVTWLNERLRKIASAKVEEVPELEESLEQEINDKYKIKKVYHSNLGSFSL
jgi:hypothetical protein